MIMCLENSNFKKTLQDLDGEDWGEPNFPSHLVTEYHRLRRVPLAEMTVEDLRLLIGQKLSQDTLEYLLPQAFEYLLKEPWVSGDFFEGDLLQSVLSVSRSFWQAHPEFKRICDQIVQIALVQVTATAPEDLEMYDIRILQLLIRWQQISPG